MLYYYSCVLYNPPPPCSMPTLALTGLTHSSEAIICGWVGGGVGYNGEGVISHPGAFQLTPLMNPGWGGGWDVGMEL